MCEIICGKYRRGVGAVAVVPTYAPPRASACNFAPAPGRPGLCVRGSERADPQQQLGDAWCEGGSCGCARAPGLSSGVSGVSGGARGATAPAVRFPRRATRALGKQAKQNRKLRPPVSMKEGAGMKAGGHTQHQARHRTHALEGRLAPPTLPLAHEKGSGRGPGDPGGAGVRASYPPLGIDYEFFK
jgi:hypothetical protein